MTRNQPTTSKIVATITGERRRRVAAATSPAPSTPNDASICEPYFASMSPTVRTVGSRRNTSWTQHRCTAASRWRSNWKYIAAGASAAIDTSIHWAMWPTSNCENAELPVASSDTAANGSSNREERAVGIGRRASSCEDLWMATPRPTTRPAPRRSARPTSTAWRGRPSTNVQNRLPR